VARLKELDDLLKALHCYADHEQAYEMKAIRKVFHQYGDPHAMPQ
jgi:hypothetical protein